MRSGRKEEPIPEPMWGTWNTWTGDRESQWLLHYLAWRRSCVRYSENSKDNWTKSLLSSAEAKAVVLGCHLTKDTSIPFGNRHLSWGSTDPCVGTDPVPSHTEWSFASILVFLPLSQGYCAIAGLHVLTHWSLGLGCGSVIETCVAAQGPGLHPNTRRKQWPMKHGKWL
jgi:hypothetical protein